jgi:hypothetical protein
MERAAVEAIFDRWFENLNKDADPKREYPDRHPDCVIEHPQFKDGKIIRETRYFAEPFEAPEARAKWTKGN